MVFLRFDPHPGFLTFHVGLLVPRPDDPGPDPVLSVYQDSSPDMEFLPLMQEPGPENQKYLSLAPNGMGTSAETESFRVHSYGEAILREVGTVDKTNAFHLHRTRQPDERIAG